MNTLLWIGIIVIILWALGWLVFQASGFLIHLLLIIGVILLIAALVRRST